MDDVGNVYTCIQDNIEGEYEKSAQDLMRSSSINMCDQSNVVDSVPLYQGSHDHFVDNPRWNAPVPK